jgi:diguanylate cyclase (GGDEF)-like protein
VISHCRAHGAPETLGEALLTLTDATAPADRPRELMIEMNDGRAIAISVRSMPDGGWVATHEDITERRRVEAQIAFLARHDVLTGLANRALLEERIAQALAAKARGVGFALLFLDLDRFKAVNDNFGHPVGDHLLRAVAARLLACVREVDTAARLGGDEFVVLQVGLKAPADAEVLARRIIESLSQPYQINDHDVAIGVSIGVAIPTTAAPLPEVLIGNADVALYAAKQAGRGTYRVFGAAVPAEA